MKDFLINVVIVGITILLYHFDILRVFTTAWFGWGIGIVVFLLFLVALKILGNPFAKDE